MGVAGVNLWWGCQKKENTYSYEALEDIRVLVRKLLEVVLCVAKGVKFGVQKENDGQVICTANMQLLLLQDGY